jgi:hypothetical protein
VRGGNVSASGHVELPEHNDVDDNVEPAADDNDGGPVWWAVRVAMC